MTMRDGTRAAMLVFGRCLAEDREAQACEPGFAELSGIVLDALDALDVGVSEEQDIAVEQLRLAQGAMWLQLAEEGRLDGPWVVHVLDWHHGQALRLPLYARCLLGAIEQADDEELDTLALAYPEYVGLMRAVADPRGEALARLVAVLERA